MAESFGSFAFGAMHVKLLRASKLSINARHIAFILNCIFITLLYLQLKAFYHIKLAFRVKLAAITPLKFKL